ncbi:MAG: histidine kinase dimerization/phospho-acceptor domain-containing protein [Flavobacteriales bacterium]
METTRKPRENKLSASLEFIVSLDRQLRTPLSTIIGMLELIEIESMSEDQCNKLESIQKAANEISLLVDDLHQIVESESLGVRSDVKPFNLEQLMMLFQNKLERLGLTTILGMYFKPTALIGDLNAMIRNH